jgi:hypothetical protein
MKKTAYLFLVCSFFCVLLSTVSCSKKDGQAEASAESQESKEAAPAGIPSVILTDTSKWTEKSEGLMAWAAAAVPGEVVEALTVKDEADPSLTKYETKRAAREKLEGERDFYHVTASDGRDYWVQDFLIAVDAVPCVVLSDSALLYTKPDIASLNPRTLILPQYAVLGLHETDANSGFACVSGYVTEFSNTPVVAKQFVKRELITADPVDIQALRLYKTAMANKNEVARRELLNNALTLDTQFLPLIREALAGMNAEKVEFSVVSYDGGLNCILSGDGSQVNARDKPGIAGSNVIFKLDDRSPVIVSSVTFETETVGGVTDHWYSVVDEGTQKSGWVFGAYLAVK